MARGGMPGFESRPLVPATFTGFRSWKIMDDGDGLALRSVTFPCYWQQGVNEAQCLATAKRRTCGFPLAPPAAEHTHDPVGCYEVDTCEGVELRCGCGFWCYDTPTHWSRSYFDGGPKYVVGVVHGFGKMVVGTKGFRAGKAVIAGLAPHEEGPLPADVVEGLQSRYWSVPIFDTVAEMLALIPLTPIPSSLLGGDVGTGSVL